MRFRGISWLLGLAALSVACGDAAPPPAVLRLWKDLPATVVPAAELPPDAGPGSGKSRPGGLVVRETLLLSSRFDGQESGLAAPVRWHSVQGALTDERLSLLPLEPQSEGLRLVRGQVQGVLALLEARPGESLSLRVTLRSDDARPVSPQAWASLVELREPLDPAQGLPIADARRMLDRKLRASHSLEGEATKAPRVLRTDFVVDREARQLALYVLPPLGAEQQAVRILSVELWRVPIGSHVAAGGEVPQLTRMPDGHVRVDLDRDERQGLLALPGSERRWTLPSDERPRRLDLAVGVRPRSAQLNGAMTLRVRWNDQLLHELRVTAPSRAEDPAWQDLRLNLPASKPGEPAVLSIAALGEGPDPPLVILGHPTLRAGTAAQPDARPNVVLISLDTLRPDRLGSYGGPAGLAPQLDALAAAGLRFAQAYSTSSYTLPSHASLFTGQFPALHGAVNIDDRIDDKHSPLLTKVLADAGYVTAAFTGGGYVAPDYGFGAGFDRYSSNDPVWALDGLRGQQLIETVSRQFAPVRQPLLQRYATPAVESWLARQDDGRPFFLFLHTYIVHNYAPDLAALARHGLLGPKGEEAPFDHRGRTAFNEGQDLPVADIVAQYLPYYDATISMADDFVGRVLAALESAGLSERTIVIITSDHGEEFGEHGFFGHGETLYDANTRIPLIVRLPAEVAQRHGLAQPAVHEGPISLVDVAPFTLRLVGLEVPARMSVTRPLGPDRSMPPSRSRVFMELDTRISAERSTWLTALRDGSQKLHILLEGQGRGLKPGDARLYDLAGDAAELRDLSAHSLLDVARLRSVIDAFHEVAGAIRPRDGHLAPDLDSLSRERLEELQAIGYLPGIVLPER
ncbi:MAG: sulfatase [Planctomycetota bacterium]